MHVAHKTTGAPMCAHRNGWARSQRLLDEGHLLVDPMPVLEPGEDPQEYRWNGSAWEITPDGYARRARRERAHAYPSVGDQLDAIWKQLNYDRMNAGRELIQEADDTLAAILRVKRDIPVEGADGY